jgi:hypothetical protein
MAQRAGGKGNTGVADRAEASDATKTAGAEARVIFLVVSPIFPAATTRVAAPFTGGSSPKSQRD